jgi:hypothetical protein
MGDYYGDGVPAIAIQLYISIAPGSITPRLFGRGSHPWYTDTISESDLVDFFGLDHTLHVSRFHPLNQTATISF